MINNDWIAKELAQFEKRYQNYLTSLQAPQRLKEAMGYSALNGGKRIRALLLLATGYLLDSDQAPLFNLACAIEMIHSYSLVHDDLPAMDDDTLRRGQPTCHLKYDEATAILVGDALLSESFALLSEAALPPERLIKIIRLISTASGAEGMVGGQYLDLESEHKSISLSELESIHRLKTGALIRASILAPALAADLSTKEYLRLDQFAQKIGLAFQIKDDILDVIGNTEKLGKHVGQDQLLEKATYTALLGVDEAKRYLEKLVVEAEALLNTFKTRTEPLASITTYILERDH